MIYKFKITEHSHNEKISLMESENVNEKVKNAMFGTCENCNIP